MQIESLKIFCDIVRLQNFSQAARNNKVTQSMASQTVHGLEQRLDVKLIDRSQRPWKLTAEGRVFYEGCMEVVEQYYSLEERIRSYHDRVSSIIRVASIYSVGLRHMGYYIHRFSQLYPWTQVKVQYLHPDSVYQAVLEDTADIGIVSFPRARRDLTVTPWQAEPMVLVCPADHPLARRRKIAPEKLAGETFVTLDKNLDIRKEIDRYLKTAGAEVTVTMEFDNIEVIKQAVELGSGISILPGPAVEKEVTLGTLKTVELSGPPFVRPLGIIQRKGRVISQNVSSFADHLQNHKIS